MPNLRAAIVGCVVMLAAVKVLFCRPLSQRGRESIKSFLGCSNGRQNVLKSECRVRRGHPSTAGTNGTALVSRSDMRNVIMQRICIIRKGIVTKTNKGTLTFIKDIHVRFFAVLSERPSIFCNN